MKHKQKFILAVVAVLLLFTTIPGVAFAADTDSVQAAGYSISNFDVDIVVNENNTYLVKENITVDFTVESRGITRDIPVRFNARWQEEDGDMRERKYQAVLSDISANTNVNTERSGDSFILYLGDEDTYVTGEQHYEISYLYDAGDDGISAYDMFYYNIIGDNIGTYVDGVDFTITMPKEFDASKIGFSVGKTGSAGYNQEELSYSVDGNTITGTFAGRLNPYEAVTARIELPEGYYVGARKPADTVFLFIIVFLAMAVAVAVLAIFFGRKQPVVQTVEFYPPEGMTSADVGFVIDGVVEDKDVVSLLIYWADKGYIEIHEGEKSNMTFKKIKDLPESANEYEVLMFNKMFIAGDTTSTKDMQYKFADTVGLVKKRVKAKYETKEDRVFKRASTMLQDLVKMLAAFPIAAMAMLLMYDDTFDLLASFLFAAMIFLLAYYISGSFVSLVNTWQSEKRSSRVGMAILWISLSVVMYLLIILIGYPLFGWVAPLACASSFVMTVLAPTFRKRTDKGLTWYGRILGLKDFIQKVEAEKLKLMVEEDPAYFYNVLPYAYVLGVSDKWAKRFESIAVEPPHWYYGYSMNTFTTVYFTSALTRSMARSQAAMTVKRDSSGGGGRFGGGGFSGGGFSGGGFGGGGVGRW
ncbi:MAG: DUF2207 domain-containing protein [Christensenellaceae bacterium]|jgi:uncharacterized membrane protein YgcG